MKDEVVIIEAEPKLSDGKKDPDGTYSMLCNYEKELYEVNQPITRRPKYAAVRDVGSNQISLLFKIDHAKSVFEKGQIVPQGKPAKVTIYLRKKNQDSTDNIIWYTSFQTLLMHNSTEEFIQEKSKPIVRAVVVEHRRVLCNGYSCNHIFYCKFFNHSTSAIVKTKVQDSN